MARRIMIIAGLGVAVSGYLIFFQERDDLAVLFIISLILLVLAYTFQFQLDQLMIRGEAQKLDASMAAMLRQSAPHYAALPMEKRLMLEDRMMRWILKKEFIIKDDRKPPEDLKHILAYYACLLTLHQEDYHYPGIDRFVFYHHPFLTPGEMDHAHIVEVELVDGTVILSVPHLLKGHFEKGYYNIALHAMAILYRHCYLRDEITWEDGIWSRLEAISHIRHDQIEAYIGIPVSDPWPVAVHHQLTYRGSHIAQVTTQIPQLLSSSIN